MKRVSRIGWALFLTLAPAALGQSNSWHTEEQVKRYERHEIRRVGEREEFDLGVCVGQSLAQQNIYLPAPMTSRQQQDPAIRNSIDTATQNCREQMRGASGSPAPSPLPT